MSALKGCGVMALDTRQLGLLKDAEVLLEALADDRNWYDETPKDGGPMVAAWRGKGEPENMARKALALVERAIVPYVGYKAKERA